MRLSSRWSTIRAKIRPLRHPDGAIRGTRRAATRRKYRRKIAGKPLKPFAYTSKGSLASLGMSKAVADVYGIKLSGTLAWLLWRGFYLSFLPGFAAKFRVGVTWLISSVMPANIVQIQSNPPATRYVHYRRATRCSSLAC